jgi:tetraacyldisaccharide 4'-kinase
VSSKGIQAIMSGEARGLIPSCCRAGLWLLSVVYGLGARAKNLLFDAGIRKPTRVTRPDGSPLPIACIGNLTAGGTGKTPMVGLVVREMQEMGKKPGILSRGYGNLGDSNDEALMLAESLPACPTCRTPTASPVPANWQSLAWM